MNGFRITCIAFVVAVVGLMAMTATAYAGQSNGSTSTSAKRPQADTSAVPQLRGVRDFGLSYTPPAVLRDTRQAGTSAVPQLRGVRDFGLSYVPPAVLRTDNRTAAQPVVGISSGGFNWTDAGVGAAAMLGLVLLVGGLGAAVILRGHRGEYRSA